MKAADVNEDQGGEYFDFSHVVAVFFDPLEEGLFDLNKMHRSKNVDHDTYAITLHLEIVCVNLSMRYYQAMIELGLSYRDWETDRKSTRLNSSHSAKSRMPSSA